MVSNKQMKRLVVISLHEHSSIVFHDFGRTSTAVLFAFPLHMLPLWVALDVASDRKEIRYNLKP